MKAVVAAVVAFFMATQTVSLAADFVPPQKAPVERYAADWSKSPFTLKTAPVAVQKASAAKDLALGGISKIGDNTTVVLVNTKTRERTVLRSNEAAPNGMILRGAYSLPSRRDSYVEVAFGSEVAVLKYDEAYLKQLSAAPQVAATASARQSTAGALGASVQTVAPGVNVPLPLPPIPGTTQPSAKTASTTPAGSQSLASNSTGDIPTPPRRLLMTGPNPARKSQGSSAQP